MKILVVGIGHRFRGDDAVGPLVADAVAAMKLPGVTVMEHHGEGTDLMERWRGFDHVIVVDATCSGAPPGTIARWDAAHPLPAGLFPKGSHVFGVAEGIEMARVLGCLPSMTVFGVEGKKFAMGDEMSAEVVCRVVDITHAISAYLVQVM